MEGAGAEEGLGRGGAHVWDEALPAAARSLTVREGMESGYAT